ncbi:putative acyl-CoA dehydrogenase 6 isoform X3 [Carettochelys insculpta]|uniref:putative acyl-CoA dehydrogenase 6 isoform X3 n=1 Tax=Carettochelys insculpta TaxID=44489 RepID=UPI003EBF50BA
MCCPLLPAGPAMARCWAGLWARAAWAKGRFVLGGPARAGDLRRASGAARAGAHWLYTREHYAVRESLRKIIDKDINPFVDKWEEEGQFPAHKIFKILGQAGFLGVNKPTGVHIAKKIDKMGMRSSDTAQIFFEDVRVPSKYLIGEEGMGFTYQMLQFQEERLWAVANILAPMENVIQETIDYTRQRKIYNQPILHNQTVHFRLAELATEVELLHSLLYQTVALYLKGNDVTKFASMAKLKAGRLARELTDSCLQFWGGMGFTNEVLVSRLYRDSRLLSIGAGADEVMLSIICKYMGTLP